jgi:hypothetical protein
MHQEHWACPTNIKKTFETARLPTQYQQDLRKRKPTYPVSTRPSKEEAYLPSINKTFETARLPMEN